MYFSLIIKSKHKTKRFETYFYIYILVIEAFYGYIRKKYILCMKRLLILSLFFALYGISMASCNLIPIEVPVINEGDSGQDDDDENSDSQEGFSEVKFREMSGDVINPERGLYYPYDFRSSSKALTISEVKSKRKAGHTILFTQYRLDKWMSSDIPDSFLSLIQNNFDAIRSGGAKCVLRFCYKQSESDKPWDAEEKWVMRHIEQVKPILQRNEDVILVYQAGYVGVWGEWYYTDNFIMNPESPEDYLPRKRILEAMLDALPSSRQVAVRTPDFKMMMYGLSLSDTLSATTAHNGSVLSRIGGYNDCFGASEDDYGTYTMSDSRDFWNCDTRYTLMGGETCNLSDFCLCNASISDMEKYHWTYLNIDYNGDVLGRWKRDGCYNEIKQRLGYRIVLESVQHTGKAKSGKNYNLVLNLRNDGFSAFQNPRDAKIIFVSEKGTESVFDLECDPRTWHPGQRICIKTSFKLPASKGTVYLHLADPLLPQNPLYSAALANADVWDPATGYNKLFDIE